MRPWEDHPDDDALVDYVAGLDAENAPAVRAHLGACAECETRLRAVAGDYEAARVEAEGSAAPPSRRSAAIALAVTLAVAASIVAAVLIFQAATGVPERQLASRWIPVDATRVLVRGEEGTPTAEGLAVAVEAYARHDPAEVVRVLDGRSIPAGYEPVAILYADALLRESKAERARQVLTGLEIETLPQPDRDRARWLLAQARLRLGDREGALALLGALAGREGELREAAREAMRRLR